ncbi:hypothetical protein V0288_06370 [Pannus brasiliensis CCIBt3594]|uniref:Uncharacterized protein n=1 Tax=Pannus brasiliensis CCIBt3594 TaxID=1427578 RepID=A0AAW9QVS1_9CHRO
MNTDPLYEVPPVTPEELRKIEANMNTDQRPLQSLPLTQEAFAQVIPLVIQTIIDHQNKLFYKRVESLREIVKERNLSEGDYLFDELQVCERMYEKLQKKADEKEGQDATP